MDDTPSLAHMEWSTRGWNTKTKGNLLELIDTCNYLIRPSQMVGLSYVEKYTLTLLIVSLSLFQVQKENRSTCLVWNEHKLHTNAGVNEARSANMLVEYA